MDTVKVGTVKKENIGSSFDSFLEEEGILEECSAVAIKRVLIMELQDAMKENHVSKTTLAKKLHTSRSQLNRILSPEETGTSLDAIANIAAAIGKKLEIRIA